MVSKVAKYITQKPFLIQVAKDNVWEDTWNIEPYIKTPDAKEIVEYLTSKPFETIAIEALFRDAEDKVYILGLVFNDHLKIKSPEQFINCFVSAVSHFRDFKTFIGDLDNSLVGQKYLLEEELELVRIGIVNHWFSVGPCDIWKEGESMEMSINKLKERLQTKTEVIRTNLNYQGMAFLFNLEEKEPGLRHWVKSPCSKKVGEYWELDNELILKYLREWQGYKINNE